MTAYDSDGAESDWSDEVTYIVSSWVTFAVVTISDTNSAAELVIDRPKTGPVSFRPRVRIGRAL